ncbi:diaminopimelate epimerase [Thermosipho atlanticus]|uniref:Diaminopimelate epimerase n=1 Tax=Thermosipho atlanticus DSM 15807 TaxID=1123380 RepID=A0A1M5SKD5_9BACT|nr:diaminopimelate epimerase [Thermosipho atlanticus]SHH39006.1 diaminopimelate epimerase [Thermosipho atlanticus DSM 15807]
MKVEKFTATGNTFLVCDIVNKGLSDEQKSEFVLKNSQNRDGVLFVEKKGNSYFMDYFNKDGKRAPFCGNGARTFLLYLKKTGYVKSEKVKFNTYAGEVSGILTENGVMIKMPEPTRPKQITVNDFNGYLLSVGVPHFVTFVKNVDEIDVLNIGKMIRIKLDANVNFVQIINKSTLKIRTFERGVENETLACGSGATASAYVFNTNNIKKITTLEKGGKLFVHFQEDGIYLEGGVENV